jgi:hypothetical protein
MFDPILIQSIQRWEYEGGSFLSTDHGYDRKSMERNKSSRSWDNINRLASENAFDTRINALIKTKVGIN